jgi:hypothetical protein
MNMKAHTMHFTGANRVNRESLLALFSPVQPIVKPDNRTSETSDYKQEGTEGTERAFSVPLPVPA